MAPARNPGSETGTGFSGFDLLEQDTPKPWVGCAHPPAEAESRDFDYYGQRKGSPRERQYQRLPASFVLAPAFPRPALPQSSSHPQPQSQLPSLLPQAGGFLLEGRQKTPSEVGSAQRSQEPGGRSSSPTPWQESSAEGGSVDCGHCGFLRKLSAVSVQDDQPCPADAEPGAPAQHPVFSEKRLHQNHP